MGRQEDTQARKLLAAKCRAALGDALQEDGRIPDEQFAAINRLEHLIALSHTSDRASRSRWPLIAALAVTLTLVSALLFVRVSDTEIEMNLMLSELTFRLPSRHVVTNVMDVSMLGISGLETIRLPRLADRSLPADSNSSAVTLTTQDSAGRPGTVTIEPMTSSAGTIVNLKHAGAPFRHQLTFETGSQKLNIGVDGNLSIGLLGQPPIRIALKRPRPIAAVGDESALYLDVTLLAKTRDAIAVPIPSVDLSLMNVELHRDLEGSLLREVSAISSGVLYFDSLNGIERKLRVGEALRLENARGVIRSLQLLEDRIAVVFHGRVSGIQSGYREPIDLMPTYLEWLHAQHGLSLLWATTIYAFGLLVGALRWWGVTV